VSAELRPVKTRRDLSRFIELPYRLYKGQANWVPPLRWERRQHLDRKKNPFFEHAEAEYLLALRDGDVVGRISAHIDHRLNEVQENEWGLFGFFDSVNDPAVAGALLDAAEGWNRERGRDRMVGPFDFSTNHECGLLVEGYELKPQIMEFWHFPYYRELLEGWGLAKAMDLYKWELHISDREKMLPILFELAAKVEPEHGVVVRNMRRRDFEAEVRRFMKIYNEAWERNWGFVPLTDNELRAYAKQLKPLLDEEWAWIAEKDGEPIGAALTLLDWNQVLATMGGRLFPVGWLRFLLGRRKIDRVRVWALGVRPDFQHTGVAAKFYVEHFEASERSPRIKSGEMGWILEENTAMNRGMEAMNGRIVKKYRLYEKAFG